MPLVMYLIVHVFLILRWTVKEDSQIVKCVFGKENICLDKLGSLVNYVF